MCSMPLKSKKPAQEPTDSLLITMGKVLYGDRAWQQGLADFFEVHVNTIHNWVYGIHEAPSDRYKLLNNEVNRRQILGDLPR